MASAETPHRRLLIAVDIHRYSSRTTYGQIDAQGLLIDALEIAAHKAGLDQTTWNTQSQGDGVLAVLPADVNEATVAADFIRELGIQLKRANHAFRSETRIRVRVAIHSGIVHFGRNGFPGPGAIEVCRLLDAPPLKKALIDVDDADLALIVSEPIYKDIVHQGFRGLEPGTFRQVHVTVKEFTATAYITLPGHNLPPDPPPPPTQSDAPQAPTPPMPDLRGANIGALAMEGDAVTGPKIGHVGGNVNFNHGAFENRDDRGR